MIVQQIVNFTSINFIHGHSHCKVATSVLPVIDASVEQICDSELLEALHRIRLTGASLAICENRDCSGVENQIEDGTD